MYKKGKILIFVLGLCFLIGCNIKNKNDLYLEGHWIEQHGKNEIEIVFKNSKNNANEGKLIWILRNVDEPEYEEEFDYKIIQENGDNYLVCSETSSWLKKAKYEIIDFDNENSIYKKQMKLYTGSIMDDGSMFYFSFYMLK